MIAAAEIATEAAQMRYGLERHRIAEYLPYTASRMRLLFQYPALRHFVSQDTIQERVQALIHAQKSEPQHHRHGPFGSALYNPELRAILRDHEGERDMQGETLLSDAITIATRIESRRIKEMGGADVDVLVIGTGTHAASFADRMREQSPHASMLMLTNQSQRIGTFGRLKFQLNTSAERITAENYYEQLGQKAGPDDAEHGHHEDVALAMHDLATGYPQSEQISLTNEQVEGVLAAPAVLETQATRIRKTRADEKATGHTRKYAVETFDTVTGEPITYYADVVFAAPGTGKEKELEGVRELSEEAAKRVLASEVAENYLDEHSPQEVFEMVTEGVSIVGGGDSGRIAAEKLISNVMTHVLSLPVEQQIAAREAVKGKITWYGVHFTDQQGYLDEVMRFEVGKRHYEEVARFIADPSEEPITDHTVIPGLIVPVRGHVTGVAEGADHKPQVVVDGQAGHQQALVISSIGYENNYVNELAGDFAQNRRGNVPVETVYGRFGWHRAPIATKIPGEAIYWGGAMNHFEATRAEKRGHIVPGITMRTLIPRTEVLADQIARGLDIDTSKPSIDDLLAQAAHDEAYIAHRALLSGETTAEVGIGLVRPAWIDEETAPVLTPHELESIYRETEEGHALYEAEIYGPGVTDPSWSHWYSLHMGPILQREYSLAIPTSRVKLLLERANDAHKRYAAEMKLQGMSESEIRAGIPAWYANYILARLEASDTAERPIPRHFEHIVTADELRAHMAAMPHQDYTGLDPEEVPGY